jgi:hypothetical protein
MPLEYLTSFFLKKLSDREDILSRREKVDLSGMHNWKNSKEIAFIFYLADDF